MDLKFNFKKLQTLKGQKKFKKRDVYIRPDLYWQIAVYVVALSALASAIFGHFVFQKVNREIDTSSNSSSIKKIVDKERLDKALEYFELREKRSVEILQKPSPFVDPSV